MLLRPSTATSPPLTWTLLLLAQGSPAPVSLTRRPGQTLKHGACEEAGALLAGPLVGDAAAAAEWRERCASQFPYSRVFGGARVAPLSPELAFDGLGEAFGRLAF